MSSIADVMADPEFNALDYSQKRDALRIMYSQDNEWGGMGKPQQEEVLDKTLGPIGEQGFDDAEQPGGFLGTLQQELPSREQAGDVFSEYVAPGVEMAAGLGGTAAGTVSPIPGGGPIGGALAYGGAKQATRGIENLIRGESDGGFSAKNIVTRPMQDVAEGAVGEILPVALQKTVSKIIAPGAKKFGSKVIRNVKGKMERVPTTEKADLLKLAKEKGIDLLPTDISGSKTTALFESFLEKLPGSSDVIRDLRVHGQIKPLLANLEELKRSDATQESINEVGEKISKQVNSYLRKETTANEDTLNFVRDKLQGVLGTKKMTSTVAEEAQSKLIKKRDKIKKIVSNRYDDAYEALPTEEVETTSLAKASETVLSEMEGLPAQSALVKEMANWVKSGKRKVPEALLEQISQMDKSEQAKILKKLGLGSGGKIPKLLEGYAKTLSSELKKADALLGKGGSAKELTEEGRHLAMLKKGAQDDLGTIAEKYPDSSKKLKVAKLSHAKYADIFKKDDIRAFLKSKPKDLIDRIIVKDNVKGVREARKAMGRKGFDKVRDGFTNKLLGVGKHDVFDPKYLSTQLKKYEDDVLTEVYGADAVKGFKQIAEGGLELLDEKPGASFIKTISKEWPQTVVDALIGKEGSKISSGAMLRNMSVIKKAISEKEFNALGDKFLEKIMDVDKHTKLIKPQTFAGKIEKYSDRLKVFYPEQKVKDLQGLASLSRDLSKAEQIAGNPSGSGQINVMWGLLNLVRRFPSMTPAAKAATALVGVVPKKLAQFYTSPAGRKYLTEGYKVPKNKQEVMDTATKIATLANIDLETFGIKSEKKEK